MLLRGELLIQDQTCLHPSASRSCKDATISVWMSLGPNMKSCEVVVTSYEQNSCVSGELDMPFNTNSPNSSKNLANM